MAVAPVPATSAATNRGRWRAIGAVVAGSTLLGTTGTASALGPDSLDARVSAAWRVVIGAIGLVAVAWIRGAPPWRVRVRSWWLLVGAFAVAANQVAFFEALARTGVAVGTLVTIAAIPVAAGLIDLVGGSPPSRRWVMGVAIGVAGVVALTGGAEQVSWIGIGCAVLSGVAAALVGRVAQQWMLDRPTVTAMATVVTGGALLVLPFALDGARQVTASWSAALTVVYLGLVPLTAAYVLWGTGLATLSLGTVAAVSLLEPAVASILATTVLDEPLTASLLLGVALVLAGVGIASIADGGSIAQR